MKRIRLTEITALSSYATIVAVDWIVRIRPRYKVGALIWINGDAEPLAVEESVDEVCARIDAAERGGAA